MSLDAKIQTEKALDRIEELLGKRPRGIWPSEHCINSKVMDMFNKLGVQWTISDEGILSILLNLNLYVISEDILKILITF